MGNLGALGLREVYMQVIVLITGWVGPIEGGTSFEVPTSQSPLTLTQDLS